ncbi:hypothetical protein D1007_16938 [Hordeum vulgare]|nr:hypothetical protein D1007_16938 [Hordeum vulgare]
MLRSSLRPSPSRPPREEEVQAASDGKAEANHVALSSLELKAHQALRSICRLGLESSFVPPDVRNSKFSSELVKEFKGVAKKVDNILEEECRDLFPVAATLFVGALKTRVPSALDLCTGAKSPCQQGMAGPREDASPNVIEASASLPFWEDNHGLDKPALLGR